MRTAVTSVAAIFAVGLPILAGALVVEIENPAANLEALSKHAVLVTRTTACHFPEKTSLAATAEGIIDGQRRTIALKLIPLSTPGTFAVTHEWPSAGIWAIKVVARNPEYQNYVTGTLIRFDGNSAQWASAKHYFRQPSDEDVAAMLDIQSSPASATPTQATLH